jgi:hypothetical protein
MSEETPGKVNDLVTRLSLVINAMRYSKTRYAATYLIYVKETTRFTMECGYANVAS